MDNFWQNIPRPIFTLAPMEDVTDTAFRELVMRISTPGLPHILFTEFTAVDGIMHPVGRGKVTERFVVSESERALLKKNNIKLVAQIWGTKPENFLKSAQYICEAYDFDGLDINMGCPVKNVVKQGACSALIGTPDLAKEIVLATKEGSSIPVSVKTRTGVREHVTEEWINHLLDVEPAALILHGRTQKMQSERPAEWDEIAKAVAVKNERCPDMPLLGNGDLFSYETCIQYTKKYGVDGVMIGRGIFGDPWIYNAVKKNPSKEERFQTLKNHVELYWNAWGPNKNFNILKRFFKIYANGFDGAAAMRHQLMLSSSPEEVYKILEDFSQ